MKLAGFGHFGSGEDWRVALRTGLEILRAQGPLLLGSLLFHLLLLFLLQWGLRQDWRVFHVPEEVPIEIVVLPDLPPAQEAEEEEAPGPPQSVEVAEEDRSPETPRVRAQLPATPGPNVEGFRRFVRALECTPQMAAESAEMSYACRRVAAIMEDLTAEEVARLKARAAGIAYARGWALPPPPEELEQETIRKDTEKGAPDEDVMGPWPWE